MATIEDFEKLDIRVGEIIEAEKFEGVKKPAYQLLVDFGDKIGIKKSSAQLTQCYEVEDLIGRQVLAVINFPPRRILNFSSDILVLGTDSEQGIVLIQPEQKVKKGDRLF